MSMSSTTGRKNVFERIEADLASQIEDDDNGDGESEEIVAEKGEEEGSSDETADDESEDKEAEGEEEDTVGEK